ncbi:hypothetical protein [Streptomyces sp. NPDC086023]|uniref:hypothetical protein n=1 Tax=Streptomyces sp. NPDC086023 TaxID=3365746 RepID=UPI0037D8B073
MALVAAGEWTVGTVCDGVSMAPRAERGATLAAEVGARVLAALLTEGRLPEEALETSARRAGPAVAALAGQEPGPARRPDRSPAPARRPAPPRPAPTWPPPSGRRASGAAGSATAGRTGCRTGAPRSGSRRTTRVRTAR